jgi:hypothetical protein
MKKLLALFISLFTVIGTNAFAQGGYVLFVTTKDNVYDEFTEPGVGLVAPGDVTATFLWASVGTSDPLGAGVGTNGVAYTGGAWSTISSMLSSGWTVAKDTGTGAEADVAVATSGSLKGGLDYNNGVAFQLANSTGGDTYEMLVIGWDNLGGASTLEQAMTASVILGWSGSFYYATGATAGSAVDTFSQSGEAPFGVGTIPEPTTLALAGLGGLSLLLCGRFQKK